MPLSKKRMREIQSDYRVKIGKCNACHRMAPIHRHHPDYDNPFVVVLLCASCHKKVHLYKEGKNRKTSNPYINPILKLKNAV